MADTEVEVEKVAVKIEAKREDYTITKSASGAKSLHSGDEIALALDGANLDTLYGVAATFLGQDEGGLREKYAHLNPGMQRMNLGNRIRGGVAKINKTEDGDGIAVFTKAAAGMVKETAKVREAAEKAAAAKAAEKVKAAADKAKVETKVKKAA